LGLPTEKIWARLKKILRKQYIEMDFADSANFIPITEIQIGPKINIDTAEKGLSRFLKNSKYKNVEITKSKIPLR